MSSLVDSVVKFVTGIVRLRGNTDNTLIGNDSDRLRVSGYQAGTWSVAQAGSWTVAATQSGTWTTGRTWTLASGTDSVTTIQGTSPWVVSGTVTANQGGTWNINNITGTISLPTGAATAANQTTANTSLSSIDSKLNTLGQKTMAASVPVVIASNQSTISVSSADDKNYGTVGTSTIRTAAQIGNSTGAAAFGAGTTNVQTLRVVLPTDQTAIPASQSGTWNINNITGTVSLPTGAATAANQVTGNNSLANIETTLTRAANSTTAGQTGNLAMGAVTTATPTYTNNTSNFLSLTTGGRLRVDSQIVATEMDNRLRVDFSVTEVTYGGVVYTNFYSYSGSGYLWGFQCEADNDGMQIRLQIDGQTVVQDLTSKNLNDFGLDGRGDTNFHSRKGAGTYCFYLPRPIPYSSSVTIAIKRDNAGAIKLRQYIVYISKN